MYIKHIGFFGFWTLCFSVPLCGMQKNLAQENAVVAGYFNQVPEYKAYQYAYATWQRLAGITADLNSAQVGNDSFASIAAFVSKNKQQADALLKKWAQHALGTYGLLATDRERLTTIAQEGLAVVKSAPVLLSLLYAVSSDDPLKPGALYELVNGLFSLDMITELSQELQHSAQSQNLDSQNLHSQNLDSTNQAVTQQKELQLIQAALIAELSLSRAAREIQAAG